MKIWGWGSFRYVNHILGGSQGPIMAYEYRAIVHALSTTPLGIGVLFEFLSDNWNRVLRELPFGKFLVGHIYWTLADLATSDDELTKVSMSRRFVSAIITFLRGKQNFFYFFIGLTCISISYFSFNDNDN